MIRSARECSYIVCEQVTYGEAPEHLQHNLILYCLHMDQKPLSIFTENDYAEKKKVIMILYDGVLAKSDTAYLQI